MEKHNQQFDVAIQTVMANLSYTARAVELETMQAQLMIEQVGQIAVQYQNYHSALPLQMRNHALFQAEDVFEDILVSVVKLKKLNATRRTEFNNIAQALTVVNPAYREGALRQLREVDLQVEALMEVLGKLEDTVKEPLRVLLNI